MEDIFWEISEYFCYLRGRSDLRRVVARIRKREWGGLWLVGTLSGGPRSEPIRSRSTSQPSLTLPLPSATASHPTPLISNTGSSLCPLWKATVLLFMFAWSDKYLLNPNVGVFVVLCYSARFSFLVKNRRPSLVTRLVIVSPCCCCCCWFWEGCGQLIGIYGIYLQMLPFLILQTI